MTGSPKRPPPWRAPPSAALRASTHALWHALARLLPAPLRSLLPATAQPPACGLGLDGLPLGLGQLPVGTPVALAWQDRVPDRLWAQALLQDLLQHGPVVLLADHEHSVDPLLQQPALAQACAQGRLVVWLMKSQQAPLHELFDELELAGLGAEHALVVLASVRTQLGSDVAQVQRWGRQLGRWCRTRRRPVVCAFNAWSQAEQVLAPLHALAEVFSHVALLGSEAQHPLLYLDRWNGSDGPLFEARFGLQTSADGQRLQYDGSQMRASASGLAARLVEAPDQYQVIATQAALAGQRGVPASWTLVPALENVPAATQDAVGATLLLHSGASSQQENLLQTVYQLRRQHGRALKIVVHETQDKLRSNLEQALLCLGANAVVYREVGFARLQRLLQDMGQETFVRPIPADYALARAGFMPDALRGYLPTLAFCDSVEAMLARTVPMGMQHSFLRLSMQPRVAHLDAIQACTALRDGDVLSTDQNALYVFMFACAETDIDPALARLFSIPPSALFAAQTLYGSVDSVRTELRALREAARNGVPDYSAYRSERASPVARDAAAPAPGSAAAATPDAHRPAAALLQDQAAGTPLAAGLSAAPATPTAPTVHARALTRRSGPQTKGNPHAA